jgi:hypothetical protein
MQKGNATRVNDRDVARLHILISASLSRWEHPLDATHSQNGTISLAFKRAFGRRGEKPAGLAIGSRWRFGSSPL